MADNTNEVKTPQSLFANGGMAGSNWMTLLSLMLGVPGASWESMSPTSYKRTGAFPLFDLSDKFYNQQIAGAVALAQKEDAGRIGENVATVLTKLAATAFGSEAVESEDVQQMIKQGQHIFQAGMPVAISVMQQSGLEQGQIEKIVGMFYGQEGSRAMGLSAASKAVIPVLGYTHGAEYLNATMSGQYDTQSMSGMSWNDQAIALQQAQKHGQLYGASKYFQVGNLENEIKIKKAAGTLRIEDYMPSDTIINTKAHASAVEKLAAMETKIKPDAQIVEKKKSLINTLTQLKAFTTAAQKNKEKAGSTTTTESDLLKQALAQNAFKIEGQAKQNEVNNELSKLETYEDVLSYAASHKELQDDLENTIKALGFIENGNLSSEQEAAYAANISNAVTLITQATTQIEDLKEESFDRDAMIQTIQTETGLSASAATSIAIGKEIEQLQADIMELDPELGEDLMVSMFNDDGINQANIKRYSDEFNQSARVPSAIKTRGNKLLAKLSSLTKEATTNQAEAITEEVNALNTANTTAGRTELAIDLAKTKEENLASLDAFQNAWKEGNSDIYKQNEATLNSLRTRIEKQDTIARDSNGNVITYAEQRKNVGDTLEAQEQTALKEKYKQWFDTSATITELEPLEKAGNINKEQAEELSAAKALMATFDKDGITKEVTAAYGASKLREKQAAKEQGIQQIKQVFSIAGKDLSQEEANTLFYNIVGDSNSLSDKELKDRMTTITGNWHAAGMDANEILSSIALTAKQADMLGVGENGEARSAMVQESARYAAYGKQKGLSATDTAKLSADASARMGDAYKMRQVQATGALQHLLKTRDVKLEGRHREIADKLLKEGYSALSESERDELMNIYDKAATSIGMSGEAAESFMRSSFATDDSADAAKFEADKKALSNFSNMRSAVQTGLNNVGNDATAEENNRTSAAFAASYSALKKAGDAENRGEQAGILDAEYEKIEKRLRIAGRTKEADELVRLRTSKDEEDQQKLKNLAAHVVSAVEMEANAIGVSSQALETQAQAAAGESNIEIGDIYKHFNSKLGISNDVGLSGMISALTDEGSNIFDVVKKVFGVTDINALDDEKITELAKLKLVQGASQDSNSKLGDVLRTHGLEVLDKSNRSKFNLNNEEKTTLDEFDKEVENEKEALGQKIQEDKTTQENAEKSAEEKLDDNATNVPKLEPAPIPEPKPSATDATQDSKKPNKAKEKQSGEASKPVEATTQDAQAVAPATPRETDTVANTKDSSNAGLAELAAQLKTMETTLCDNGAIKVVVTKPVTSVLSDQNPATNNGTMV